MDLPLELSMFPKFYLSHTFTGMLAIHRLAGKYIDTTFFFFFFKEEEWFTNSEVIVSICEAYFDILLTQLQCLSISLSSLFLLVNSQYT